MSHKVRITASGWENYTGSFGGIEFLNGLSAEPLVRRQIDRISALVRVDLVDDDGELIGQGGMATRMSASANLSEPPSSLRKATQEEMDIDRRERINQAGKAPSKFYTKDELELIASKEGIAGLRKIGDAWFVRDRAINKLVAMILRAQQAFQVSKAAQEDLVKKNRQAALDDALARNAAREAMIDARARLVIQEGTSNAIGPNGENISVSVDKPVIVTQPVPGAAPVLVPQLVVEPIVETPAPVETVSAIDIGDVTATTTAPQLPAGELFDALVAANKPAPVEA